MIDQNEQEKIFEYHLDRIANALEDIELSLRDESNRRSTVFTELRELCERVGEIDLKLGRLDKG